MTIIDPGRRVLSRLSLTALTQALEELALMLQDADEGGAIIATFQYGRWFPPEFARYARLGSMGPVIVGFGDEVPDLPEGVTGTVASGAAATEWSFIVISRPLCAALVSRDRRRDDRSGAADTTRAFVGDWTFRRHEALDEARRLLTSLSGAPDRVRDEVEAVLQAASTSPTEHPLAAPMPNREHPNEPFLATAAEQLVTHLAETEDVTRRLLTRLRIAVDDTDRDPLTLLHNRRYLERVLRERDADDAPEALVVLSVDVLGMGSLNAEHGDGIGDQALVHVAQCLSEELRDSDIAVRWDGDKFIAVLPGDDVHVAQSASARLLTAIAEHQRPADLQGVALDVRIGSALADRGRTSFEAVEAALEDARGDAARA